MQTWPPVQSTPVPGYPLPAFEPVQDPAPSWALDGPKVASATWPTHDLVRRLCLALNIAKRAIGVLGESGYWDKESPEGNFGPDKPLAETAMLLYVASAVSNQPEVKQNIDELSRLLEPYARSHRTACAIALHPSICFQLAMPHILLTQLGLADARFDRILALSAASEAHRGREVEPHRLLEVLWLQSLWSGTAPGTEFEYAAANSVLSHPVDLFWGAREDAYAHTHAFMYFTNFGYAGRPLPRPRLQVLGESSAVLARSLLLEDFDLAAEVLMAWPLTMAPWAPAAIFGLRVLAEFEDRVGFLPAGNGVPERFDHLTGTERTKYALAATYHTAYVMGMLCALALRFGSTPPYAISGPLAPLGLLDEILSMIPEADTPWQHTFRQLEPVEQHALVPFLLDMSLLTRGRMHDFSGVSRLLELAVRYELADACLCAQAAELVGRIAHCADSGA